MKLLFAFFALAPLLLVSCGQQVSDKREAPGETKTDIETINGDATGCSTDRHVPVETANLWKNAWLAYQAMILQNQSTDIGIWPTFEFSGSNILNLVPSGNPSGLRVYFGLSQPTQPTESVEDYLNLFLVVTELTPEGCSDVYIDSENPILMNGSGLGEWTSISNAESQIANWVNYIDACDDAVIRVYAYNYVWSNVEAVMGNNGSNRVHFTPALHTVDDPGAEGFSQPVVNASCNEPLSGYLASDLVMEGFDGSGNPLPSSCSGILDFANPCPIYCGQQNLLPSSAQ